MKFNYPNPFPKQEKHIVEKIRILDYLYHSTPSFIRKHENMNSLLILPPKTEYQLKLNKDIERVHIILFFIFFIFNKNMLFFNKISNYFYNSFYSIRWEQNALRITWSRWIIMGFLKLERKKGNSLLWSKKITHLNSWKTNHFI